VSFAQTIAVFRLAQLEAPGHTIWNIKFNDRIDTSSLGQQQVNTHKFYFLDPEYSLKDLIITFCMIVIQQIKVFLTILVFLFRLIIVITTYKFSAGVGVC